MNNKEIIKYIDLIIKDIDNFSCFSIDYIIRKHLNDEQKKDKKIYSNLIENIVLFGDNHDLFVTKNTLGESELTERGKRLKLSNKTFKNFQKSERKSEWYNKPWVGYLIAAIVFIFTVYQHFDNRALNNDFDSLNKKYDSLEYQSALYKDSVSELKQQLESQKTQLKKDTLSTSYHSHLNN